MKSVKNRHSKRREDSVEVTENCNYSATFYILYHMLNRISTPFFAVEAYLPYSCGAKMEILCKFQRGS